MISGFSIVKNGDSLGYPYCEALLSLAPFVQEIVVAHGDSLDSTLATLESLRAQIKIPLRIIASPWDGTNLKKGLELSRQTNIALDACQNDVCFYIQADEVIDDATSQELQQDLQRFAKDDSVDGLALHWRHFYGNFDTIVESRRWYRREVRVVKRSRGLRSFGDAQGFRIEANGNWIKPRAALSRARMLHYGWVRPPEVMVKKTESLDRLWHGNARDGANSAATIYKNQFGLKKYPGPHPAVMQERVQAAALEKPVPYTGKVRLKDQLRLGLDSWIESLSGVRLGEFKNYRSLRKY